MPPEAAIPGLPLEQPSTVSLTTPRGGLVQATNQIGLLGLAITRNPSVILGSKTPLSWGGLKPKVELASLRSEPI